MKNRKIRVGLVGANSARGWASASHLPAIAASDSFELVAACTTSETSARETAQRYGAKHAVTQVSDLVRLADIDLVVVSIRAPAHFDAVAAAIDGGKSVLCEWPVGISTADTAELAQLAKQRGVRHFCGLQGRTSPEIRQARDWIASGKLGHLLSTSMIGHFPYWGASMPPGGDYLADAANGATFLSIICGHSLDMLEYLLGDIASFAAQVDNRFPTSLSTSGAVLTKTSPDRLALTGYSCSGIPMSVLLEGGVPGQASFWIEIHGTSGRLRLETIDVPEILQPQLSLMGADGDKFEAAVLDNDPSQQIRPPHSGAAANVARLYEQIAEDLLTGTKQAPDFDHATRLRFLLDRITLASDQRMWSITSSRTLFDQG